MTESAQICIATFPDEMSAEVAKTSLAASGIPAFISTDDCGGMAPHLKMITAIRLLVHSADVAEATAILEQPPLEGDRSAD